MVDQAVGRETLGVGFPEQMHEVVVLGWDDVGKEALGDRLGGEEVRG